MHSHDRTMIARLGFDDPDKKDPLHDKACRYVCLPQVAIKIINSTIAPTNGVRSRADDFLNKSYQHSRSWMDDFVPTETGRLKVSRSFVNKIKDSGVTDEGAICSVIQNLGMKVGSDRHGWVEEVSSQCEMETPISKGEGQYKTTVGFIDVLVSVVRLSPDVWIEQERDLLENGIKHCCLGEGFADYVKKSEEEELIEEASVVTL